MNNWKQNMLAGHAIITVTNLATNKHFTYRIVKPSPHQPHFVSLLTGPNNEEDYTFIGTIFDERNFYWSPKSKIKKDALGVVGFLWLWRHLDRLPEHVRLDNAGYCFRCGKLLTTSESLTTGYGPSCQKIVNALQY